MWSQASYFCISSLSCQRKIFLISATSKRGYVCKALITECACSKHSLNISYYWHACSYYNCPNSSRGRDCLEQSETPETLSVCRAYLIDLVPVMTSFNPYNLRQSLSSLLAQARICSICIILECYSQLIGRLAEHSSCYWVIHLWESVSSHCRILVCPLFSNSLLRFSHKNSLDIFSK